MRSSESKNYKKIVKMRNHPQVESWRAIMGAFQNIYGQLDKQKSSNGVHMSRFQILLLLYFEGPMSAAELARKMLVTRGNISTFIKRLEADGQVEICESSPSDKRPLYCLSETAIVLFEEMFQEHIKLIKELVPKLNEDLLEELWEIAKK